MGNIKETFYPTVGQSVKIYGCSLISNKPFLQFERNIFMKLKLWNYYFSPESLTNLKLQLI